MVVVVRHAARVAVDGAAVRIAAARQAGDVGPVAADRVEVASVAAEARHAEVLGLVAVGAEQDPVALPPLRGETVRPPRATAGDAARADPSSFERHTWRIPARSSSCERISPPRVQPASWPNVCPLRGPRTARRSTAQAVTRVCGHRRWRSAPPPRRPRAAPRRAHMRLPPAAISITGQSCASSLAPSACASPLPPCRITMSWLKANAGRAIGPNAFIHGLVVRTRQS